MGGLPLLRQGEHLSPTRQAYVPSGFRTGNPLIAKRIRYPLQHRGCPPELQVNKANISDNESPFLDLYLSVANGFVSSKMYDKRDDFDFDI